MTAMQAPSKHLVNLLIVLLVCVIPLTVLGINLYALHCWMEIRDLEKNGIAAEAIVLSRASDELPRNSTYRVMLRYEARSRDGRTVVLSTEQVVGESVFSRSPVGGKVTLYYTPGQPERVHVRGNMIYVKYVLYALVGDLLLAIAATGFYRMERKRKLRAAPAANSTSG